MRKRMNKLLALGLAVTMVGSNAVCVAAADVSASGEKWSQEETADGWIKVTNEGGETLGYSKDSGVTLIEQDGYAFKDLDKDGELDVYEDWREDEQTRAEDLAGKLSTEQIAGLRYTAKDPGADAKAFEEDLNNNVRHFLGNALANSATDIITEEVNKMQEMAEKADFGIPVIPSMDPPSKYMHNMSALALASTFDTEAVKGFYNDAATAMRSIGVFELLGPQADLATEPRWSRAESTFGEDPALVTDMVKAAITGLQSTFDEEGNDLGWGEDSVIAQVKHFPGDGAAEGGRESHNKFGKYNVYPGDAFATALVPFFDGAFKLGTATESASAVMPSYSIAYDEDEKYGELVGSNFSEYKINLLRENGYDGIISTDSLIMEGNAGNVPTISVHGMDGMDSQEVIYQIIKIGIDRILMPDFGEEVPYVQQIANCYDMLVEEFGEEAAHENFYGSAVRLLREYMKTGAFENPYTETDKAVEIIDNSGISNSFSELGQKSIVMLKNNEGTIAQRGELPTVYIPMTFKAAASGGMYGGSGTPASWSLPIDEQTASQYMNIVTDTVGEPSGKDEEGNAVYTEEDIVRASAEDLAACDMAAVFVSNPSTGNGYDSETDTYKPISLQYGEYTADSESVRKESISQGVVEEVVETPYGPQTNKNKEDRSYYGESTSASNYSDLELIQEVAAAVPETCKLAVCVTASNAMIFSEFENDADAILVSFGAGAENFLPILGGQTEPSGLLPIQMPAGMETVEAQMEDVPRDVECYVDSNGNTYDFTFGLNWSGKIEDERVAAYNAEPLTTPETITYTAAE
ncbi:MAG: glycoside hydrolase family 3 N-terminal domain-containing protein [Eubacteriales bacterium]|nr:glycoside hydrolase family 3 N-terminal domain-containing protein [Eubacteriales bacterium]